MDASASPLNPYVVIRLKSANVESFEVVNRSASMGKSLFYYKESQKGPSVHVVLIKTNPNTTTVVLDLEKLHATVLDGNPY
jgi:hypothetical protein